MDLEDMGGRGVREEEIAVGMYCMGEESIFSFKKFPDDAGF